MRVVNLSRRPFVNRRPIARIAVLLWITGAVLLAVNVRLYTGHWLGSAENRRLLAEVRQKLASQRELLAERSLRFRRVSLDRRNRRAAFLNQLIDARTFPWSALFDDLEEVLPPGVRLVSVRPAVRLASNRRSRALAERARTVAAPAGDELAQDEVELLLNGVAESFDQLDIFVDRLFERPFRDPFLSSASLEPNQGPGATVFNLSTVYLTRREPLAEPAAADSLVAGDGEEEAPAAGQPPASEARRNEPGTDEPRVDGPAGEEEQMTAADSRPSLPAPPDGGTTADRAETPDRRAPDRRAPDRGASAAGRPARPDVRPGLPRPGVVELPDTPVPVPERERTSRSRPSRRQPLRRQPPDRPAQEPSPPRDRPPERRSPADEDPSFGDRDASSTPAIRQRPRQLGSMAPAGTWQNGLPVAVEGGVVG